MNPINPDLLQIIVCPQCGNALQQATENLLRCENCLYQAALLNGKPMFTPAPETIEPWEKIERGPNQGTAWRRANWHFLQSVVSQLPTAQLILDVGAGHGDFADIFTANQGQNPAHRYLSLDVVPYAEVDMVCDLNQTNPLKPASLDLIVLMNVLEHVFDAQNLLRVLARALKPSGQVVVTIPFMLKVHQAPFDFSRYTEYGLAELAKNAGLKIQSLQGYYDPLYILNESLGNLWQYALPESIGLRRTAGKGLVFAIQKLINLLGKTIPKGHSAVPTRQSNPAPCGYFLTLTRE